jgi:hypothetical protein
MSLQDTEDRAAAVSKPGVRRISLDEIKSRVVEEYKFNIGELINDVTATYLPPDHPLHLLSCCFLVFDNGFTIIGKSAPVSRENFNQDYGFEVARDDALRQAWPLMGFEARTQGMALAEPPKPDAVAPAGTVPGTIAPDDPF